MSLSFVTLDVFTTTPYAGNPVGIIHVPASTTLSQQQKQLIAREFNLSECVFLHEQDKGEQQSGEVRIDIFTAIAEVPFAGHPTIGVSNYLLRYLESGTAFENVKVLQTKAGRIAIELLAASDGVSLKVAHDVHIHNIPFPDQPFRHHPVVSIVKGMTFILAQLPDLEKLAKPTRNLVGTENTYRTQHVLDEGWREGIVTSYYYVDLGIDARGHRQLRTRMFGSREDPATGSAASALCSYLSLSESGISTRHFQITQGVEMGRKSEIYVQTKLNLDGTSIDEVILSGSAVKVMEGKLNIPP